MAVEWICPHCGQKQYSACEHKDEKTVKCVGCKQDFLNQYFKGE